MLAASSVATARSASCDSRSNLSAAASGDASSGAASSSRSRRGAGPDCGGTEGGRRVTRGELGSAAVRGGTLWFRGRRLRRLAGLRSPRCAIGAVSTRGSGVQCEQSLAAIVVTQSGRGRANSKCRLRVRSRCARLRCRFWPVHTRDSGQANAPPRSRSHPWRRRRLRFDRDSRCPP